jgi:hypothetical protein
LYILYGTTGKPKSGEDTGWYAVALKFFCNINYNVKEECFWAAS